MHMHEKKKTAMGFTVITFEHTFLPYMYMESTLATHTVNANTELVETDYCLLWIKHFCFFL